MIESVGAILERPDSQLDYAQAKIALDRLIDPGVDAAAVVAELDQMAKEARALAGAGASEMALLSALRRLIYEPGQWNGWRAFSYNHEDPRGRRVADKLLHNYLAARRGQCVSMPILFLILAERVGLRVALACAPEHVFVRFTDAGGRTVNLETTSGAHPARDEWYRQNFPITDRSIANGLHLRSLTRREAVALMATTLLEHLLEQGQLETAIIVGELMLQHRPNDAQTMVCVATASAQLLDRMRAQQPSPWSVSPLQRAQMLSLVEKNVKLFAAAEQLGWVPFE